MAPTKKVGKAAKPVPKKRKAPASSSTVPVSSAKKSKKLEKSSVSGPSTSQLTTSRKLKVIPIDEHFKDHSEYHVYHNLDGVYYGAMLNLTEIGTNTNKFFNLQLLAHNKKADYRVWMRWGRIGCDKGDFMEQKYEKDFDSALAYFKKKFRQKSGNAWEKRMNFVKKKGKYNLLEEDLESSKEKKVVEKSSPAPKAEVKEIKSKLDKRVACAVDLILDLQEFEETLKNFDFDVKKSPLGKISSNQIQAAYEALQKIEAYHMKKEYGDELAEACNEFYTLIPHNFGRKRPPLIVNPSQLKSKVELLRALGRVQIAMKLVSEKKKDKRNPRDIQYDSLHCTLEPYDKSDDEYKMVDEYLQNTNVGQRKGYELTIENVFKMTREEDEKQFKRKLGNRMLLWHGASLTNWCGILKEGLQVPSEKLKLGWLFGRASNHNCLRISPTPVTVST